jgi:hypothetical protein
MHAKPAPGKLRQLRDSGLEGRTSEFSRLCRFWGPLHGLLEEVAGWENVQRRTSAPQAAEYRAGRWIIPLRPVAAARYNRRSPRWLGLRGLEE